VLEVEELESAELEVELDGVVELLDESELDESEPDEAVDEVDESDVLEELEEPRASFL
jgi:hypothetical protein